MVKNEGGEGALKVVQKSPSRQFLNVTQRSPQRSLEGALCDIQKTATKKTKRQREISKFKVLRTVTWTLNSKSFILYIYFNAASTSSFAACICEEEVIIRE